MLVYAKTEQKKEVKDIVQKKEAKKAAASPNLTGIPDDMKTRFESCSGLSFDDVRVHYNSNKPSNLQALAYTQGNQVHIAPGQEKHLGHELGHVVQQKQGKVKPTIQLHGVGINNDKALENEADTMSIDMTMDGITQNPLKDKLNNINSNVIQLEGEIVKSESKKEFSTDQEYSKNVEYYFNLFNAASSKQEQRKLYFKLSRELHPDKNPGINHGMFAAMSEAYHRIQGTVIKDLKDIETTPLSVDMSNSEKIRQEFQNVLYIRKTKIIDAEIEFIIRDRSEFYIKGNQDLQKKIEDNYWHAAFTVIDGLPVQEYDSFKSSGLVISARTAELAGWGKIDMAMPTKCVPKTSYPDKFPIRASASAFGKTKNNIADVEQKLKEIRARYRGEIPDVSSSGKSRQDGKLYMDFGSGLEVIDDKKPYLNAQSIPYGEAQIHYKPSDILGVYVEVEDEKAIKEAIKLKEYLDKLLSKDFPLVEYSKGSLIIHDTLEDFFKLYGDRLKS